MSNKETSKQLNFVRFAIAVLATWRLVEMIKDEDAPFESLKRFRDFIHANAHKNVLYLEISTMIECEWCLSVWVGWFVAKLLIKNDVFISGLALSAGSLILKFLLARFKIYT